MKNIMINICVAFFDGQSGVAPVRDWLFLENNKSKYSFVFVNNEKSLASGKICFRRTMIESSVTMPEIVQSDDTFGNSRGDRSAIDIFPFGVTMSLEAGSGLQENYTAAFEALLTSESSMAIVSPRRDSLYIVVPITVIYVLIFFTGLIGNISTCVVIARNRSMHTATNYYLFSLAISDLLLLISGLPPEMYYIWSHFPYIFGEIFCMIQSFAAETSANATVLTITAFTVERFVIIFTYA